MSKFKVFFVDDDTDIARIFLLWSHKRKEKEVNRFIKDNLQSIWKETGEKSAGLNFLELLDKFQNDLINYNSQKPKLNKLANILFTHKNFKVNFAENINKVKSSCDLLILDVRGVLDSFDDKKKFINTPFIIFTGYSAPEQKFKQHTHFITSYKKGDNKFNLLMEGIEQCALNKQVRKEYFSVANLNTLKRHILHFFFPLDIDLQGLKDAKDQPCYIKDTYSDLEGLYKLEEYKDRNIKYHYRRKLFCLWYLLGKKELITKVYQNGLADVEELTPVDDPPPALLKLAGIESKNPKIPLIYKFFESMDNRTFKNFADFNIKNINGDHITSFNQWYCCLDEELQKL